uniref:Uncharacterized protein n=1 Tax=Acrobeloides nanus TaxID=290746 RepID=A0A914CWK6_9BILA
DRTESLSAHTQKGIDFLEKYGQFVKERALIEEEYALKIRNLVKKSTGKKKDEDDEKTFSYISSFQATLHELDDLAGQHEVIAERLKKDIVPNVTAKCQQLRAARKQQLVDLQAMNSQLASLNENVNKFQKNYAKAFKDAEAAYIKADKADKNMELSRADVEKTKHNARHKEQICEEAKQSYAHSLGIANQARQEHFQKRLPALLDSMRGLDVERISEIKLAMSKSVEAETSVMRIIQRCYDAMNKAIEQIDPAKDTHIVVENLGSGYAPPEDDAFIDLGNPSNILHGNGESAVDGMAATLKRGAFPSGNGRNVNGKGIPRKQSMHQKLFGGGNSTPNQKANTSDSEYGSLPPMQRVRKIEQKLKELDVEIAKKEQSRAGIQKMLEAYKSNPKMGNPGDVEPQIGEYSREIVSLNEQRERFKRLLLDAKSELNTPISSVGTMDSQTRLQFSAQNSPVSGSPRVTTGSMASSGIGSSVGNNKRTSYSDESISSESSALSSNHRVQHPQPPAIPNGHR